jgi:putative IMPACT (imprinted ancient) family translation regulator
VGDSQRFKGGNIAGGQDSARQYNAQFASAFSKMNTMPQNYAQSPANAFSFSCKSGNHQIYEFFLINYFFVK